MSKCIMQTFHRNMKQLLTVFPEEQHKEATYVKS